ncbi:MAG: response regulator [Deltaproteobacteria bacterium]|nr:response regulator [Deltaproteobacteria bacterium]
MPDVPQQSWAQPARPYAIALRDMAGRYEELVRGLSILKQIDSLDDPQRPLRDICIRLLQTITQNLLADNGSLMMLDARGEHLELWAATGFLEEEATWIVDQGSHTKFRVGEGFAGRAVETGQPISSEDVTGSVDFLPQPGSRVVIRSLMCFPLVVEGRPIGVINLSRSAPPPFGRDVECMMGLVAERCARLLASHRVHAARRESEAYHQLVCENAGDGILVFDASGKLVTANAVAAKLLESPLEGLLDGSQSCTQHVVLEDLPGLLASRTGELAASEPRTVEYRIATLSGVARHLEERSSAVLDPQGRLLRRVCVVRDSTERKRAEESRQLLEVQLYHAQKMEALGELAGGVTHDFNNLLTGILGSAGLARTTNDIAELRELLGDIETAAGRASALTRQLLSMSRRALPARRPVDVAALLREVAGVIRNTFDRRIRIAVDSDSEVGLALADSGQIHQMLLNLCVNARDSLLEKSCATGNDDLSVSLHAGNARIDEAYCSAHIEATPGDYVRIDVADTGSGIPAEAQARIFEPFFTTKGETGGTGLGLAIVYGIIKQHSGWIVLDSEPGLGTTFRVFLPVAPSESVASIVPPTFKVSGGSETILLVDDDEVVRKLARRVLVRLGYTVLMANDGLECLETYEREAGRIDAIILDLCMPRMSGEEVLKRILANHPDARIIVSSGHTQREAAELELPQRPAGYLTKPYSHAQMATVLRRVLDGRMQEDG